MATKVKEKHFPFVTFVMPAYNVENYINEAVASIISQEIGEWELIIIDDGSTDSTLQVAESLALKDERIKVISLERGSGSAYQPRKKAILRAQTEWVAPLDADDWIESDYLSKLWSKQQETEADIVYPTMWSPGDNKHLSSVITPKDPSLYSNARDGLSCVKLTLDGWKMNCNGGLIKKSLYERAFEKFDSSLTYSCADELLTRELLSITPKVAFSDARYFYRPNEASITRRKSLKLFDFLINTHSLIFLVKELYGEDSEEYILAHRQNFHAYFDALRILNKYEYSKEERQYAYSLIDRCKKIIDTDILKGNVSHRYLSLIRLDYRLSMIIIKLADSFLSMSRKKVFSI